MKKTVQAFVATQGHTSHYSGKSKTLYITGPNAEHVELQVIKKFGKLPFETTSQAKQLVVKPINRFSKAYTKIWEKEVENEQS